jgi:hypothetical protein
MPPGGVRSISFRNKTPLAIGAPVNGVVIPRSGFIGEAIARWRDDEGLGVHHMSDLPPAEQDDEPAHGAVASRLQLEARSEQEAASGATDPGRA